jgi:hypothetical protein
MLNFPFGFVAASTVVRVFSLHTSPAFATLQNQATFITGACFSQVLRTEQASMCKCMKHLPREVHLGGMLLVAKNMMMLRKGTREDAGEARA